MSLGILLQQLWQRVNVQMWGQLNYTDLTSATYSTGPEAEDRLIYYQLPRQTRVVEMDARPAIGDHVRTGHFMLVL